MKRNLNRQRQLEQIQVDRQLQNLKDLRARERFKNSFHSCKKNTPIKFEEPPIGIGKKYIFYTLLIRDMYLRREM